MTGKEDLCKLSPLPLKGRACQYYCVKTIKELIEILTELEKKGSKYYFLGRGYNTLFADKKIEIPIISCREEFFFLNEEEFIVGAFMRTAYIGSILFKRGISNFIGVETIPGTIGAGIKGNASFQNYDFYQGLKGIYVYQEGKCRYLRVGEIERNYRETSIEGVILLAIYQVIKDAKKMELRKNLLDYRLNEQDSRARSLGSTFKNTPNKKAYELLKEARLRSSLKRVLSQKHMNFLSVGNSMNPKRLYRKLRAIKKKVRRVTGVNLDFEIKVVGREGIITF